MTVEIDRLKLFAKPEVRIVFEKVAKERRIRFKDLQKSLQMEKTDAQDCLNQLVAARLIQKRESLVPDFNSYFVTEDGLWAERQLRRMDLTV